jgi:DNA-binding CsgD family transcriptional regulator
MNTPTNRVESENSLADNLTPSELTCLRLTAEGIDQDEIAKRLGLPVWEIEMLFYCAARKLKAENRLHAVCIAAAENLIWNYSNDRKYPGLPHL